MNPQKDGGPAFPTKGEHYTEDGQFQFTGISVLDYFAAKAMPMIFDAHQPNVHMAHGVAGALEIVAKTAYAMADEMLKVRKS